MTQRIRGRKLQERRLRLWSADPTCKRCGKLTSFPSGFELDHIIALEKDGPDTDENCQVLCVETCHKKKTAEDMGHRYRTPVGPDGWPVE